MSQQNEQPTINCAPNGPYIAVGLKDLQRPGNSPIQVDGKTALCRCGASANKPFCDGTHAKIGFDDKASANQAAHKSETYIGKGVTIHDNRGLCAHAGVCTDRLPAVWRMKQEPWIDPDGADVAAIIDVINQCPSGALSYSSSQEPAQAFDESSAVQVTKNGPYAVTGITLSGSHADSSSADKYTLCRCGASKNKPFCDGTHWAINFQDDSDAA